MTRYAYFEGAFVPIEQAKVSIMANAFNYGTGCFEGIRAYWNAGRGAVVHIPCGGALSATLALCTRAPSWTWACLRSN